MTERSCDLILSEVLARVAFRLIVWDYRRNQAAYADPRTGMLALAFTLEDCGFRVMSMWVIGAAWSTHHEGYMLAGWRDAVVRRARLHDAYRRAGTPWRRAYDPRVTNRGVISGHGIVRRPWGARKARFPNGPIC